GAAPDSIGKCHGFVPYKQGHGSEPLSGSGLIIFVTLCHCFLLVKQKARLRCHTVAASFEVMALCLEGITNWVVYLYVQNGRHQRSLKGDRLRRGLYQMEMSRPASPLTGPGPSRDDLRI